MCPSYRTRSIQLFSCIDLSPYVFTCLFGPNIHYLLISDEIVVKEQIGQIESMADTSQKVHQQEQEQKQKQQEMDIPLLKRWIKFMQSNPGLEKSLRLLQAFLQIGAAIEIGVDDELAGRLWRARGDVSVGEFFF